MTILQTAGRMLKGWVGMDAEAPYRLEYFDPGKNTWVAHPWGKPESRTRLDMATAEAAELVSGRLVGHTRVVGNSDEVVWDSAGP